MIITREQNEHDWWWLTLRHNTVYWENNKEEYIGQPAFDIANCHLIDNFGVERVHPGMFDYGSQHQGFRIIDKDKFMIKKMSR